MSQVVTRRSSSTMSECVVPVYLVVSRTHVVGSSSACFYRHDAASSVSGTGLILVRILLKYSDLKTLKQINLFQYNTKHMYVSVVLFKSILVLFDFN